MSIAIAPVADVQLADLMSDPFAAYATMRGLGRLVWVPALDRYCVTRHEDIVTMERDTERFSTADLTSPTVRALGQSIISKDGDAHRRERASCEPALRPKVIVEDWAPVFQRNADAIIDTFADRGRADLAKEFGGKLASRNIADMLGFRGVSEETMLRWARAIVGGCSNYMDDPALWAACDAARQEIDLAVSEAADRLRSRPDSSIISAMVHADGDLTEEEMGRNAAVIIGGGINEPNHAISIAVLGLLTNPDQRAQVEADPSGELWKKVFEEAMRWIAPIAITLRKTTSACEFAGVHLEEGAKLLGLFAAANRDEDRYEAPDSFDIGRAPQPHLSFGSGPHMCMGTWMARVSVGQIAVPTLFKRLPGLTLAEPVELVGDAWTDWMFRGLRRLDVAWELA